MWILLLHIKTLLIILLLIHSTDKIDNLIYRSYLNFSNLPKSTSSSTLASFLITFWIKIRNTHYTYYIMKNILIIEDVKTFFAIKKINCNFLLHNVLSYNFSIPLAIIPKVTAQIPTIIPTPAQPSMN